MEKMLEAEYEEQLASDLSQLGAWQGGSEEPSCSHDDPFADSSDSSIDFGAQPALPMDQSNTKRLVMKRKVLRHRSDGTVEVSNESPDIEPDRNNKPWCLGHSRTSMDDTISKGKIETSSNTLQDYLQDDDYDDDDWFMEDSPSSPLGDFGSDTISEYSIPRQRSSSYIAPQADRLKRTDPVARIKKYRQEWARFSFPGQDTHQSLRWAVRIQMLQSGPSRQGKKRPASDTEARLPVPRRALGPGPPHQNTGS